MITALINGDEGRRIVVLGLTQDNLDQLQQGNGMRISAQSKPGFPADLVVWVLYGKNERAITEQLAPMFGSDTKFIAVPRDKDQPKNPS